MTYNPLNAQRRRLRNRISMVYVLPTFLAAVVLVFIFAYAVRAMLVDSAVANTETALHDRVQTEIEALLKENEDKFLNFSKRIQQATKDNAIKPLLSKSIQGSEGIVDIYYGNRDGDFASGKGIKLESGKSEFRTTGWYLEASRKRGLAYTGPSIRKDLNKQVLTLSYPIWDKNHKFRGAVAEDLSLHKVRLSMGGLAKEEGGITMLVGSDNDNLFTYFPYETNRGKVLQDSVESLLQLVSSKFSSDTLMDGRILRFEKANEHRQQLIFMVTPLKQLPFYLVHVSQHNKIAANIDNHATTVFGVVAICVFLMMGLAALVSHILFRRFIQRDLNDSVNSSTLFDTLLWKGDNFTIILTNENFDILHASARVVDFLNNGEDIKEESLFKYFTSDAFKKFAHRVAMGGQMLASERKTIERVQNSDGEVAWWGMSFQALVEDNGATRFLIMVSDETSGIQKDTILDTIMLSGDHSILVIFDKNLHVKYMSRQLAEFLNKEWRSFVGVSINELKDMGLPESIIKAMIASYEKDEVWKDSFMLKPENGSVRHGSEAKAAP